MAADPPDNQPVCETAFQQALARSANRWYSACLGITRSPSMAEDAVQDGLVNAWRKRDQFDGRAALDTWIHRIVVNSALQALRRRKAVPEVDREMDEPADERTPLDHHGDAELMDALEEKMAALTDYERLCFVLKHTEGWRLDEIAAHTGNSINSVKQALFRALAKLRASMADWRVEA